MKRRWMKGGGIALLFVALFVVAFFLGTVFFFPARTVQRWINSMDMPGRVSVSSVRLDPLLRLHIQGFTWRPERNPVLTVVVFPSIVVRPSWGGLLSGHRALIVLTHTGHADVRGTVIWREKTVQGSVTSPAPLPLPGPFCFSKGVSIRGTWKIMADLSVDVDTRQNRGRVSGNFLIRAQTLQLRWATSPLGPLNLSFATGTLKGTVDHSVLTVQTIDFRGGNLNVTGQVTLWVDPVTGSPQIKGTLFFQPLTGLAGSHPKIDAAIRFLPRGPQGYRLAF